MERIYKFLEDAGLAVKTFAAYFNIDSEEFELGFAHGALPMLTFNQMCCNLIEEYEDEEEGVYEQGDTIIQEGIPTAETLSSIFEKAMIQADNTARTALVRRIIKHSDTALLFEHSLHKYIYGGEAYKDVIEKKYKTSYDSDKEEMLIQEDPDEFFQGLFVVLFLAGELNSLLYNIGDIAGDFNINIIEEAKSINPLLHTEVFKINPVIEKQINAKYKVNNEFTMQRKKQAIMIMLEELGVRAGSLGTIPLSDAQRFIYFLTGIGERTDVINDTSVATAFKRDSRTDQKIKEDCEFVASYFEKLGLTELARKARNDK